MIKHRKNSALFAGFIGSKSLVSVIPEEQIWQKLGQDIMFLFEWRLGGVFILIACVSVKVLV